MSADGVLDALQDVLADEHAALYTYGVLGARTSQSATPALYDVLTEAYRRHRARRDRLRLLVADLAGEPVAAAPAYEVPAPAQGVEQVQVVAREVEGRSTEALAALVARSSGEVRSWALDEAVWSATWQVELGGSASTWPGAPELG